jgi:DNA-binding transcriptional ArsR family regulator
MSRTKHELRTAVFQDGTHAVLRADPAKPRHMEVIATFYEAAHARDYIQRHGASAQEHHEVKRRPTLRQAAKRRPKQAAAAKTQSATRTERKAQATAHPKPATKVAPKRPAAVQPKSAAAAKTKSTQAGFSDRQLAVLKALRSLKDKKNRVEVPVAKIAQTSSVPLGSVHSILASLEKKHMIKTERQGSPKASAVYEVLPGSLNGGSHRKQLQAAR